MRSIPHFPCVVSVCGHSVVCVLIGAVVMAFTVFLTPGAPAAGSCPPCAPGLCTPTSYFGSWACARVHTHTHNTGTHTYRHTCTCKTVIHRHTHIHIFLLLFPVVVWTPNCLLTSAQTPFIPLFVCSFYSLVTHFQSRAKPFSQLPSPLSLISLSQLGTDHH